MGAGDPGGLGRAGPCLVSGLPAALPRGRRPCWAIAQPPAPGLSRGLVGPRSPTAGCGEPGRRRPQPALDGPAPPGVAAAPGVFVGAWGAPSLGLGAIALPNLLTLALPGALLSPHDEALSHLCGRAFGPICGVLPLPLGGSLSSGALELPATSLNSSIQLLGKGKTGSICCHHGGVEVKARGEARPQSLETSGPGGLLGPCLPREPPLISNFSLSAE